MAIGLQGLYKVFIQLLTPLNRGVQHGWGQTDPGTYLLLLKN